METATNIEFKPQESLYDKIVMAEKSPEKYPLYNKSAWLGENLMRIEAVKSQGTSADKIEKLISIIKDLMLEMIILRHDMEVQGYEPKAVEPKTDSLFEFCDKDDLK